VVRWEGIMDGHGDGDEDGVHVLRYGWLEAINCYLRWHFPTN